MTPDNLEPGDKIADADGNVAKFGSGWPAEVLHVKVIYQVTFIGHEVRNYYPDAEIVIVKEDLA